MRGSRVAPSPNGPILFVESARSPDVPIGKVPEVDEENVEVDA